MTFLIIRRTFLYFFYRHIHNKINEIEILNLIIAITNLGSLFPNKKSITFKLFTDVKNKILYNPPKILNEIIKLANVFTDEKEIIFEAFINKLEQLISVYANCKPFKFTQICQTFRSEVSQNRLAEYLDTHFQQLIDNQNPYKCLSTLLSIQESFTSQLRKKVDEILYRQLPPLNDLIITRTPYIRGCLQFT